MTPEIYNPLKKQRRSPYHNVIKAFDELHLRQARLIYKATSQEINESLELSLLADKLYVFKRKVEGP